MKSRLLFYLLPFSFLNLFNFPQSLTSQSLAWVKTMGGIKASGEAMCVDDLGNMYILGTFEDTVDFDPGPSTYNLVSTGSADVFIQKLDRGGNLIWAKALAGSGYKRVGCIDVDQDYNVYIGGQFSGRVDFDPNAGTHYLSGSGNIFLMRLDAAGNFDWANQIWGIDPVNISALKVGPNGKIYINGIFSHIVDFDPGPGTHTLSSLGHLDAFIQSIDTAGNLLWVKQIGGTSFDYANDIHVDSAGNVYTVGSFRSPLVDFDPGISSVYGLTRFGLLHDAYIQKLDSNGNFCWARSFGGLGPDAGLSVDVDPWGNVYTMGTFHDIVDFDPDTGRYQLQANFSSEDWFVQKLDSTGAFCWAKSFGHRRYNHPKRLRVDHTGGVYVCGSFRDSVDFDPGPQTYMLTAADFDFFVQKLDTAGNFVWAFSCPGPFDDFGNDMAIDRLGVIHTTGQLVYFADFDPSSTVNNVFARGAGDAFVAKYKTCTDTVLGTETVTACGSYTWMDGNTYTSSTTTPTYLLKDAGMLGCDSLVSLHLQILPLATATELVTACDSFTWIDGITYTHSNNSATYILPSASANGCDSIITLDLKINNKKYGTDSITACKRFLWVDGNTYTRDTTITYTLPQAAANGCDSIVTLNLTIIDTPVYGTETIFACDSYTWRDGQTYTSSNQTATFRLPGGASTGCDSIVRLDLTIQQAQRAVDKITACDSYTWIDGITYTANNNTATYTYVGGASNGCDSIVTLNLTLRGVARGVDIIRACGSFTWINGVTYTNSVSAVTHTLPGGAANGCDSIVTLSLFLSPMDVSVRDESPVLWANFRGATSYQWLDCNKGMAPIPGETKPVFLATVNGSYALRIQNQNCIDTSACFNVSNVSISEEDFSDALRIYPNPTSGRLFVDLGAEYREVSIQVRNTLGQEVTRLQAVAMQQAELALQGSSGVYFVEIRTGDGRSAVMKVVKE